MPDEAPSLVAIVRCLALNYAQRPTEADLVLSAGSVSDGSDDTLTETQRASVMTSDPFNAPQPAS